MKNPILRSSRTRISSGARAGAFVSLIVTASAGAQFLILNEGFENGSGTDAEFWNQIPAPGEGASAIVDRVMSDAHSGDYALLLESVGSALAGSNAEVQQLTAVGTAVPGATYDFRFYVKGTAGVSTAAQYDVQWLDADGSDGGGVKGSLGVQNITLSSTYSQISESGLTPPAGADSALLILRAVTGAVDGDTSRLYVDDFEFELSPALSNLSFNPGFEEQESGPDDAASWQQTAGSTTTAVRSTLSPYAGIAHAYLTVDHTATVGTDFTAFEQALPRGFVSDDEVYDLTVFAKADSADFTGISVFATIQWFDEDSGFLSEVLTNIVGELSTEYQQIEVADLTPPPGAKSARLRFQLAQGAVSGIVNGVYLDEVSFSSQGAPPEPDGKPCLRIDRGTVVSWMPTSATNTYQPQESEDNSNWTNLGGAIVGDLVGKTFDADGAAFYRVLESDGGLVELMANGSFETPDESTDLVAENWEQLTEDPNFVSIPDRITTDANTGSASMKVAASSSGSALVLTVSQIVGLAGGPEVIPGETYDFSFFAKDVNNGPGFVKEYLIRWLNENDDEVAFEPFTGFSNGSGNWYEVTATGLVAPANASDVQILFFGKTGAFAGSEGEFLIDDVSFSTQGGGGGGTVLSATSEEGYGLSWDTVDGQLYGVENSTDLNGFTDTGIEVTGDGNPVSVAVNSTEPKLFFRLFCE